MTDDEFRELVERAHQIREVTRHEGWTYLTDRAAINIGARQQQLLQARFESMEEYKRTAGWVEGALWVLQLADTVQGEVERERGERRERETQ